MTSFERHYCLVLGVFWALTSTFVLALIYWWQWVPGSAHQFGRYAFPAMFLVIAVLGILLLTLMIRSRSEWAVPGLRRSLVITGVASTASAGGAILHNVLHGVAEATADWTVVSSAVRVLSVVFFFFGILAPIALLAAITATIYFIVRGKPADLHL